MFLFFISHNLSLKRRSMGHQKTITRSLRNLVLTFGTKSSITSEHNLEAMLFSCNSNNTRQQQQHSSTATTLDNSNGINLK